MKGFLLLLLLSLSATAQAAPTVYKATADLTTLKTHGYEPHLHTQSQEPVSQWQDLASLDIDNVSPNDVWHVLTETPIRYHTAPRLSHAIRVLVCQETCAVAVSQVIEHIDAGVVYHYAARAGYWVVPEGFIGTVRVTMQVRLLSIPKDGEQGHKVFMYPPETQSLTVGVY